MIVINDKLGFEGEKWNPVDHLPARKQKEEQRSNRKSSLLVMPDISCASSKGSLEIRTLKSVLQQNMLRIKANKSSTFQLLDKNWSLYKLTPFLFQHFLNNN